MSEPPKSRRERKKAVTRASIAKAARELFIARGFDAVSVREVADKADVSPTTVFTHFPTKEALAFGDEEERHEQLVAAVRDRPAGTSVSAALKAHYLSEIAAMRSGRHRRLFDLMGSTPALVEYARQMWLRHEDALAAAIAEELALPEPTGEVRFYVRFALHIQLFATRETDPESTVDAGFRILETGWPRYEEEVRNRRRTRPRMAR